MMESSLDPGVENQIREWRTYLLRRRTIHNVDVEELEDHLRSEISELGAAGLSGDESFLVAIKRIGSMNELSREFARERSTQLWKQLVLAGDTVREHAGFRYAELFFVVGFAVAAATALKIPALFGIDPFGAGSGSDGEADGSFYLRNGALFAFPFLAGFFAWRRGLSRRAVVALTLPFAGAAVVMNAYPFTQAGDTEALASVHVGVLLWLVAGVAYLGGAWGAHAPRMDFVRFTGEWVIYYVLVAIGGGVLSALTMGVFAAIDVDMEPVVAGWILPCGAAGAVVVVAWLVEAKQSVVENMAPVLTAVFTPLFAVMLVAAIAGMVLTGNIIDANREFLMLLDALLVLVVGLVLYSLSARDADARPTLTDGIQLVLVLSALVIDALALTAMLGRISEFGFTPNRTAGLGLNIVLLVNLAWTAWLMLGFLRGWGSFGALERWQTRYIPVYGGWALVVVVVFPLLFGFD